MKTTTKRDSETRCLMLVDDDAGVRQSLRQLFKRDERFTVVSEHARAKDALKQLADIPPDQQPDLVLLDITMPGMDGIECCRELRGRFPDLTIAMFTARRLAIYAEAARLAGADAFFCKLMDLLLLADELAGLRRSSCMLLGPGVLIGGGTGGTVMHHDPHLSPRQEMIMEFAAHGLPPKEIAASLGLSLWTVYAQLHRADGKLRKATYDD